MKVIFVRPEVPENISESFVSVQYPINIGYLASQVLKAGFEVELWDLLLEKTPQIPKEPHVYCFSCFSNNFENGHKLAEKIKKKSPKSLTIVGGVHITTFPNLSKHKYFDIGITGEADITLVEVINKYLSGKKQARIIKGEEADVNRLPFPYRDLKPEGFYAKSHVSKGFSRKNLKIAEMMTSRGCVQKCIFCVSSTKGTIRKRSFKNTLGEIEYLQSKGVQHLSIEDDIFTYNETETTKLLQSLKNLTYNCNTHVNHLTEPLVKLMKKSGCQKVSIGVESGSQRILNLTKKGTTIERIKKVFSWLHKYNIKYIESTFLLGSHPSETRDDIEKTKELIAEIKPDFIIIGIACPYPGTELEKIAIENNLIIDNSTSTMFNFGKLPNWKTDNFSPQQLLDIQKELLSYFYMNPKFIGKNLKLFSKDPIYFSKIGFKVFSNYFSKRQVS